MSALTTNTKGSFDLSTLDSQLKFADNLLRQKVISDTFRTAQQVVIAIQFCISLNVDPMTGLKNMYVVHGKPALFGDGPLSIIQSSGKLESINEFWVDGNGEKICVANKNLKAKPYAAVCQIKRTQDDQIQEDYFTIDDMAQAQLKGSTWGKYTRTMMRYRARTQAIKSKFADVLNGMDIVEYISNDLPKEDIRIDEPKIESISSEQVESINELIALTETNPEQFLKFMKIESFDLFTFKDAERALIALNQKKDVMTSKEVENV